MSLLDDNDMRRPDNDGPTLEMQFVCFLAYFFILAIIAKIFSSNTVAGQQWLEHAYSGLLSAYVEGLISLVAVGATLPAILIEQDARMKVLRRKCNRLHKLQKKSRLSQLLMHIEEHWKDEWIYIISFCSIAIVVGYHVPPPTWFPSWWDRIRDFFVTIAPYFTLLVLLGNLFVTGIFLWRLLKFRRYSLLNDIKKVCEKERIINDKGIILLGWIDFISKVGRYYDQGDEKLLVLEIIDTVISIDRREIAKNSEGHHYILTHKTLGLLAESVCNIVEDSNTQIYRSGMGILQEIANIASDKENKGTDKTNKEYSVVIILNQLQQLVTRSFNFEEEMVLIQYLDEFKILPDSEYAKKMREIGLNAIEHDAVDIMNTILDRLHTRAEKYMENTDHVQVETDHEIFHYFLGYAAHLWAKRGVYIDHITERTEDIFGEDDKISPYLAEAKEWSAEIGWYETADYLEQMLYDMNQRVQVRRYLQSHQISEKKLIDRVLTHFSTMTLLRKGDIESIMSCGFKEQDRPKAEHLVQSLLPIKMDDPDTSSNEPDDNPSTVFFYRPSFSFGVNPPD